MKILAIETSGSSFSVALADGEKCVSSFFFAGYSLAHSRHLVATIDNFLAKNSCPIAHLQALAVDKGPGSFTGIRVGLSAARAFAQMLGLPLAGVSSLDALAYQARIWRGTIVPVMSAVRGEVYACSYESGPGLFRSRSKPVVVASSKAADYIAGMRVKPQDVLFTGAESAIAEISQALRASCATFRADVPRAESLAALAWEKLRRGSGGFSYEKALPLYIKLPQVLARRKGARV